MYELTYRIEIKNCTEDDLEIIKKIIDESRNLKNVYKSYVMMRMEKGTGQF